MKQGYERFKAIPQDILDLILMYRSEHKLSYRGIEKRLDISRETARRYCIKMLPEEATRVLKEKKRIKAKKVKNNVITRKKKPLPQYNSVRDYDFLQYIRVVFKWAVQHHPNLTRAKIEMLLYLYPKGAFTYALFHKYYKLIGMFQAKALAEYIEHGYIKVWRPSGKGGAKLFALTDKGKGLCDIMHKYCTGDEKLPMDETNTLTTDKSVRINNYYVDAIKLMNKRKKATD